MKRWMNGSSFVWGGAVLLAMCATALPFPQALAQGNAESVPGQARPDVASLERQQNLDAAIQKLPSYEFGESREALSVIEDHCRDAYGNAEERAKVSKRLADLLDQESTMDAKDFVCRQLSIIAGAEAAPQLARLLTSEKTANMARYALERIADPSAGQVLREALSKATGPTLIGLINSLGARKDPGSVPSLSKLLQNPDDEVIRASASALGKIASPEALIALEEALPKAQGRSREIMADSCLLCADGLLEAGKKDEAAKIYEKFYVPSESEPIRVAAFNGLVEASPEKTVPLVAELLVSQDVRTQGLATRYVRQMSGAGTTKAFAGQISRMTPEGRVLLMDALAVRGDGEAISAIEEATKDESEEVRIAALKAIGILGGSSSIPLLAQRAADKSGPEKQAARDSLDRLRGDDANKVMIQRAAEVEAPARVELIRSLGARRAEESISALMEWAGDTETSVREEALRSLALMAGEAQVKPLVVRLVRAEGDSERTLAEKALIAACQKVKDETTRSDAVIKAFKKNGTVTRCACLRVLGEIGGAKSLETVKKALDDRDVAVQDAAVRALTEWPDVGSAGDLLEIAKTSENETHRVLALRGYVRVVGLPSYRPVSETLKMLQDGLVVAKRPDDKKLILAGLGKVGDAEAFRDIRPHLTDPALGAEAGMAMIGVAEAIGNADKAGSEAALIQVIDLCSDENVKRLAGEKLDSIQMVDNYIVTWLASGPYTKENTECHALMGIPFAPEQGEVSCATWIPATATEEEGPSWRVDLDKIWPGEQRAGYLLTWVWWDRPQEVCLQTGSDDGVKVWLNGEVVLENNVDRGATPGADRIQAKVKRGWNSLMLKVVQGGGQWAGCARFRAAAGGRLVEKGIAFASPEGLDPLKDALRAGTDDEKRQALEILAQWPDLSAAEEAMKAGSLDEGSLVVLAPGPAVAMASRLSLSEMKRAKAMAEKAMTLTEDPALRARAQEVLDRAQEAESYITVWEISGPYVKEGALWESLLDEPFGPEKATATGVEWHTADSGGDSARPWVMDLSKVVGGEARVAYVRTRVWSPSAQQASLELGSDDGVKVWLNGIVIHTQNVPRSLKPGEDKVPLKLKKGWNLLMLKVSQGSSDWSVCARIQALEQGKELGLKYSALAQDGGE